MRWPFALGFVVVSLSTGPVSCVVVDDDGGDDAGETTIIGDSGDGDGDPGDGDGDPGDGDGDGDPGDGDPGDGDGEPSCPPGDLGVDFSHGGLEFDTTGWWDDNVDWTCTATEVGVSNGFHLLLDCPDAGMPIPIDISATPSFVPPVSLGDTIHVRYLIDGGPWWFNRYLRIDVDGHGHLLTMIDGGNLTPPVEFETPFPIQLVSGLCTPTPNDCGNFERQAVAFEINGEAVEMLDGSHGIFGVPGTEVWVAAAWQVHDFTCLDAQRDSYRVLITNTGQE